MTSSWFTELPVIVIQFWKNSTGSMWGTPRSCRTWAFNAANSLPTGANESSGCFSTSTTFLPSSASSRHAVMPAKPWPHTTTSQSMVWAKSVISAGAVRQVASLADGAAESSVFFSVFDAGAHPANAAPAAAVAPTSPMPFKKLRREKSVFIISPISLIPSLKPIAVVPIGMWACPSERVFPVSRWNQYWPRLRHRGIVGVG